MFGGGHVRDSRSGAMSIAMKSVLVLHVVCVFAVCGVGYSGELGTSTAAKFTRNS